MPEIYLIYQHVIQCFLVFVPGFQSLLSRSRDTVKASRASSTWRQYGRFWSKFQSFCAKFGKSHLPATQSTVLAFLQLTLEDSHSEQNIVSSASAITAFHELESHPSPCGHQVKVFITGAKKSLGKPVNQKTPFTKDILISILQHCFSTDMFHSPPFNQPLNLWRQGIFEMFAFLAMARYDDLSYVTTSHISFTDNGIQLFFPKRKNDQLKKGHTVLLHITDGPYCPLKVIKKYFALLSPNSCYEGHLIPAISLRNGVYKATPDTPASYPAIRNCQINVLSHLNLDPSIYALHSGRRGGVTHSSISNSTEDVCSVGGWAASSSMPARYNANYRLAANKAVSSSLAL